MDIKNKRILEALQMQPLSEEEKASRHILGRLYGPIATCVESTRNGRLYNRPLWEKALVDEIFLEKVATKALFLELGHPADREETDMKQVCACIPVVPKIIDNDLYAYVDILDTPNGRLLKTLIDYGFVPGISSRGSGDVLENDQVDPETFFLETWDIVQLPAVQKARLSICESLDSDDIKLKKALAESYNAAKDEDKDTMKKALENLNIDIESELTEKVSELSVEDIPWDTDDEEILVEEAEDTKEVETSDDVENEIVADEVSDTLETDAEADKADETDETETAAEDEDKDTDAKTVNDFIELFKEYDSDVKVEFDPIKINDEEYSIDSFNASINDEGTLILGVNCIIPTEETAETEENTDDDILDLEQEDEIETSEEEITEDDEVTEESADDAGEDEVMESLKEMIRQKEALENENKDLLKAKAVGDAKVEELQESLNRYKAHFNKIHTESEVTISNYKQKLEDLQEQLAQSKDTIDILTEKVNNSTQQLKENADKDLMKVKTLTEEVNTLHKKSETLEAKLQNQNVQFTKKLNERTQIAKTYKARFIETLTRYVESKASMLGVQPSEITSRLNENYSLADVDAVCEQILDSAISYSRLPFSGMNKASAKISESVSRNVAKQTRIDPDFGYDIDDSLLELAGLKK